MLELVDFHCHPDLYNDNFRTIELAKKSNFKIIAMTNLPSLYKRYCKLFGDEVSVKVSLGYHPQLIKEYPNELDAFFSFVYDAEFIGEIGLDNLLNQEEDFKKQEEIFSKIIDECNRIGNKVISIHSGKTDDIIFDYLFKGSCIYILHWYTGSLERLKKAMSENKNVYISVNINMLSTYNGKKIVEGIPLSRILFETDAPFTNLTRESYPRDILYKTGLGISRIKRNDLDYVIRVISENSKKILLR
mgnify:CR=1 FL=1